MSVHIYVKEVAKAVKAGLTDPQVDEVIRAHLDSLGYKAKTVAEWRVENYKELRRWAYPDIANYLDAQVKVRRGVYAAGKKQEDVYLDACWAVKERFPKK